jgi:hypothetical protein
VKTDEQFHNDRLTMMESEGWLDLIQELTNIEDSAKNINAMNNEKDLWEAKGQLHILNFLLSLENVTQLAVEQP